MEPGLDSLPWRGPGPGRPDLPLPPDGRMRARRYGVWRKRWRYVGVFADELLLCAARVQVGRLGQTFWAIWDRESQQLWERTRLRLPGARGEVWMEHPEQPGLLEFAPPEGSTTRIEARHPEAGAVRGFLRFSGAGEWVESVCRAGSGYTWTRKRADVPLELDIRVGERRWRTTARAVEDESAGYHPHETVWSWSAGVGRARDGRSLGWSLVSGINDPPQRSERAIWIDGEPFEPAPVGFDGLEAVRFDDGARLEFAAEAERRRAERNPLVSYSYRQPFGAFSGSLAGGIELERGLGVMEHHEARW